MPIQCIGVYSYSTSGESFALNLDLIKLVVNDINYHIYLHVYSKAVICSSALAQSRDDYEYILLYNVRIKILLRTKLTVHDECPSRWEVSMCWLCLLSFSLCRFLTCS